MSCSGSTRRPAEDNPGTRRACSSAARTLLVPLLSPLLALLPPAPGAHAATLRPGDVVILAREQTSTPGVFVHLDVAAGTFDTITPQPVLGSPRDVVVRPDGTLLVADATLGLVGVSPGSGAATVLEGPAAFGGSGPTALAFAANGDLWLAGPTGVARLGAGQDTPAILSAAGQLVDPTGILDDGAGGAWVTDDNNSLLGGGGIVHVDAGGGQALVNASCSEGYTFPVMPLQVRRGPDGFVYVVSGPYYGPTNYLNAGIFRMDPTTNVATRWRTTKFIRGFDFTPAGTAWVASCQDIGHDCYEAILGGPAGTFYPPGLGPLALVPEGTTLARPRSWGSLKSLYR